MSIFDSSEWRVASRKLISKAAIWPDVYLLSILDTLGDFRGNPVGCASLRLAILLLLREEHWETEVSNFDGASFVTKDIVGFDITMEDISRVHRMQAQGSLIEYIPAEIFWVVLVLFEDYRCQGAVLNVFQENPNALFIVIKVSALDHLITSQKCNQTGFVDNKLSILFSETFDLL